MTIYDKVKFFLEKNVKARERKFKDKAIVHMLYESYGIEKLGITKEGLVQFVRDYASYDRMWRKVTKDNPSLRGSDYDDKEVLEQEKMLELEYEPYSFNKKLNV